MNSKVGGTSTYFSKDEDGDNNQNAGPRISKDDALQAYKSAIETVIAGGKTTLGVGIAVQEEINIADMIADRQDQLDQLEQLQDIENTQMLDILAEDNEKLVVERTAALNFAT